MVGVIGTQVYTRVTVPYMGAVDVIDMKKKELLPLSGCGRHYSYEVYTRVSVPYMVAVDIDMNINKNCFPLGVAVGIIDIEVYTRATVPHDCS